MKKSKVLCVALVVFILLLSSCATKVSRVEAGTAKELSGDWNERDVSIVCDSLLDDMFNSIRYKEYVLNLGEKPLIRVGKFANQSDEHIDTSIITTLMQTGIFESGIADFAVDRSFLDDLHLEQDYGLDYSDANEAASIGNEAAPDLLLQGSVKTIVQKNGKEEVRTYYVSAQLTDVERGVLVWSGENSEISKVVKAASARF